jgi:CBS-domain-containing membrane protein
LVGVKVREVMTRPVIHARADTPVSDIAKLLAEKKISAVPIIDNGGAVIGLVSEYDLLARQGKVARDVMTPGVISVTEDADVEDVRFLLIERRIRRVPVMSGTELIGIVSRSDLVRLMALHWICEVCGEQTRSEQRPESCPKCGATGSRFRQEAVQPGM